MQKSYLYPRSHSWRRIDSCAKSATRVSRETRTCSCTDVDTTFHGNSRSSKEPVRKKVYICPENTCVHHDPSRALGDLTGIKKHYSRKHGEKKWMCEKCSKKYAVQSDWKAHSKICGTREYRCDCGTLFSRKDSFVTHRAFCEALSEESTRFTAVSTGAYTNLRNDEFVNGTINLNPSVSQVGIRAQFSGSELLGNFVVNADGDQLQKTRLPLWLENGNANAQLNANLFVGTNDFSSSSGASSTSFADMVQTMSMIGPSSQSIRWPNRYQDIAYTNAGNPSMSAVANGMKEEGKKTSLSGSIASLYSHINDTQSIPPGQKHMSATALLQKASQMGSTRSNEIAFDTNDVFGLVHSNLSNMSGLDSFTFHQEIQKCCQDNHVARNFDGLLNSLSSSTPSSTNNMKVGDASSYLQNPTKRFDCNTVPDMPGNGNQRHQLTVISKRLHSSLKEEQSSMTRDFLGVGGDSMSRPLLQQKLSKFSATSSAMNLRQYGGHHSTSQ